MEATRGYLLMAYGHHNYGKMAENLAAGIKSCSQYPIQLITTDAVLEQMNAKKAHLFDTIKVVTDAELYAVSGGKKEVGLAKLNMFEMGVFEETIYVDVDSLATTFINPDFIFDRFKDVDFAIQNFGTVELGKEGNAHLSQWASNMQVKKIRLGDTYPCNVHSCFLYFKRKGIAATIFEEGQQSYYDILNAGFNNIWFNSVPDELLFAAGISRAGYTVENKGIEPQCFIGVNSKAINQKAVTLQTTPILTFSTGQQPLKPVIKAFYDNVAGMNCKAAGVSFDYRWIDKGKFEVLRTKKL